MKVGLLRCLLPLALLVWSGCNHSTPVTPEPGVSEKQGQVQQQQPGSPAPPKEPEGQPQPKLPTIKLWLGPKEIIAEQAIRPEEVQTGMMFRRQMGEDEGMLFLFGAPSRVSFWMRNTLLPLSCAYIDPAGTILEIHDMKPLDETSIQAATDQVQYVLEMKQGWFDRNHIGAGTVIRTERGSLAETYFGR